MKNESYSRIIAQLIAKASIELRDFVKFHPDMDFFSYIEKKLVEIYKIGYEHGEDEGFDNGLIAGAKAEAEKIKNSHCFNCKYAKEELAKEYSVLSHWNEE